VFIFVFNQDKLYAQGQGQGGPPIWRLDGNSISEGDFLGTTNDMPLVFKINSSETMRLLPDGSAHFHYHLLADSSVTAMEIFADKATIGNIIITGNQIMSSTGDILLKDNIITGNIEGNNIKLSNGTISNDLYVGNNVSVGGAVNTNTLFSENGTINNDLHVENNVSVGGAVNADFLSSENASINNTLEADSINTNAIDAGQYLINGEPVVQSPWQYNDSIGIYPDLSLENQNVIAKKIYTESIDIGSIRIKNGGGQQIPQDSVHKDSLKTVYELVLSSEANRVRIKSDLLLSENKKVGIGKENPMYSLDVAGNARFKDYLIVEEGIIVGRKHQGERSDMDTSNVKYGWIDTLQSKNIKTDSMKIGNGSGYIKINGSNNSIASAAGFMNFSGNDLENINTISANTFSSNIIGVGVNDTITGLIQGSNKSLFYNTIDLPAEPEPACTYHWATLQAEAYDPQLGTSNEGGIKFATSLCGENTVEEKMRITPDGKVGIGTINPEATLDVNGHAYFKDGIKIGNSIYAEVSSPPQGDAENHLYADNHLYIQSNPENAYNTIFNANNEGKVAIGTNDPGAGYDDIINVNSLKLDVNGDACFGKSEQGFIRMGYNTVHSIIDSYSVEEGPNSLLINWYSGNNVVVGGGGEYFGLPSTGSFTARHDAYLATNSGKVGIGTDDPQAVLHVTVPDDPEYNRIRFEGMRSEESHAIRFELHAPNSPAGEDNRHFAIINKNRTEGNILKIRAQNDDNTCKEDILNIEHNGNVGIGLSDPREKLTVKGNILSEENIVVYDAVTSNYEYPDYVFDEAYNPVSLYDLKDYIKEHKHLPEIPTKAEVAKDGIKLGEMNTKLLKKVEELTLYTIEQQKTIDELKSRIDKLEEE